MTILTTYAEITPRIQDLRFYLFIKPNWVMTIWILFFHTLILFMFLIKSVQLFQVIIFQLFSFTKIQKIKGALYLDNFCFHQKWPCTVAEETQTSSVASDNSSGKFKAGLPIDVASHVVLLSIIFRPKTKTHTVCVWDKTQFKWSNLSIHYQIEHKIVIYWE